MGELEADRRIRYNGEVHRSTQKRTQGESVTTRLP